MSKKIGFLICIFLLTLYVGNTFANSVENLRFEDGLFSGYFSGIQNNQSDVNFAYNGNNFGGIFFFKGLETLPMLETISLSGVTKRCTHKILGLYYNSQRGNRLRPLDQQSLSGLKSLDTRYNNLSMTGGFFIGCDGDNQSIYGSISHNYGNVDFEMIAGTDYNFNSNIFTNTYSGSFKFLGSRATGYIYDNYGGIAKVLGSGLSAVCGNDLIESGEYCDDGDLNGELGFCDISCSSVSQIRLGGGTTRLVQDDCKFNSTSKNNLSGSNAAGTDFSPSYYDRTCLVNGEEHLAPGLCSVSGSLFSQELNSAYQYNYNLGTTTVCPRSDADLDRYILRKELAKMISVYAMKVVGLKPISGKKGCNSYNDISKESNEFQSFMKLACELELMGIHTDGHTPKAGFDPNDFVTRAEFGTVFSRLIYGQKYNGNNIRYLDHLKALKKDGIMTQINNPKMKELRGFVMIMIQRADKDITINRTK